MNAYPEVRLRRLRRTPALRRLFDQPFPGPERFLWPVFVVEGRDRIEPIPSMPGQQRMSPDALAREAEAAAAQGIGGLLLFGQVDAERKDANGSGAYDENGAVQTAIRQLRRAAPELVVVTDVCLCAYTRHGHCGPLNARHEVDNDAANALLARVAVSHASAGADIVAPSAMMDGQVAALRSALDAAGFRDTLIMSYSTKFASAFYGPFRDAEQSAPQSGDRRGYQTSPANPRLALRESDLDAAEGADVLMVKPALCYLDVLARLRDRTDLPLAAYNVSGEYSMLIATADRGWGDLKAMIRESTLAISRAGADIIISYWAGKYREIFTDEESAPAKGRQEESR
jgi:porphobilinogen synthase